MGVTLGPGYSIRTRCQHGAKFNWPKTGGAYAGDVHCMCMYAQLKRPDPCSKGTVAVAAFMLGYLGLCGSLNCASRVAHRPAPSTMMKVGLWPELYKS